MLMTLKNISNEIWILIFIIGILLLFIFLLAFVFHMNDFVNELKYLNVEINRTDGKERKHWIRRRRKLWLSLIPFVRY